MDPPRTSLSSSAQPAHPVKRSLRGEVRRLLRIERRLRNYAPGPRPTPAMPDRADEVLIALAARYRPGDQVGDRDVIDAVGVGRHVAMAIRQWAQHPAVGLWPYRKGAPRYADWSDRERGEGGGG